MAALVAPSAPEPTPLAWRNWLNLAAYILNFALTYVSLTGVFGETNSDLSRKYQTLVTPAGWAFSIWGLIFTGEGSYAVAQMLPRYRHSDVVRVTAPWWWATCLFQVGWTISFAQEVIPLSLCFMLGILASLLGIVLSTDMLKLQCGEYALLRAPFALHLGWILVASAVNANVQVDAARASPATLLASAALSYAMVAGVATALVCGVRSPEPIISLVVAWAFLGIAAELGNAQNLNDPGRFNPYMWEEVVLDGFKIAAHGISVAALGLAGLAVASRLRASCR